MGLFSNHPTKRTLLIVLAAGLFIRIILILANERVPVSDEYEYDQLAQSIVNQGSYAVVGVPTAYRPVGYPAFLGITYFLFGHEPLFPKVIQALLDTLTAYLLFLIGKMQSERIGFLASLLWSSFVPAILFVNLLLAETLTVFLLVLSLLIFLKSDGSTVIRNLILFGLVSGIMILVKPSILLFPLLLLLLSPKMAIPPRYAIVAFAAMLVVVLPWMLRNLAVLETFSISTNGGMNLYVGNNPEATGAYLGTFPPELADPSMDEVARSRKATALAMKFIAAQPGTFLVNGVKKLAHLFRSEGDVLITSFSDHSAAGFTNRYRSVAPFIAHMTNVSSFGLLFLGITGFVLSIRSRQFWFTVSFLAALFAVHFVFFGGSRFHFVLMPFAAIYASHAIVALHTRELMFTWTQKAFLLACFVLLSAIWSYELFVVYLSI
jgi:hypothetical protein